MAGAGRGAAANAAHAASTNSGAPPTVGPRTRAVVLLPDGSSLAVDFDATVASTINTRVRMHTPAGAAVIATPSDGRVFLRGGGGGASDPSVDERGDAWWASHADVLDGAAAVDNGTGLAPRAPVAGQVVACLLPAPPTAAASGAAAAWTAVTVTDAQRNIFTVHACGTPARPTFSASAVLAGATLATGVTDVLAADARVLVVPHVESPRPPLIFHVGAAGGGTRLLDASAVAALSRSAASVVESAVGGVGAGGIRYLFTAMPAADALLQCTRARAAVARAGVAAAAGRAPGFNALSTRARAALTIAAQAAHESLNTPVTRAVPDATGCGIVWVRGRDEIRVVHTAWMTVKTPRGREANVVDVFGDTARQSP